MGSLQRFLFYLFLFTHYARFSLAIFTAGVKSHRIEAPEGAIANVEREMMLGNLAWLFPPTHIHTHTHSI